jgi:hypothetical protein
MRKTMPVTNEINALLNSKPRDSTAKKKTSTPSMAVEYFWSQQHRLKNLHHLKPKNTNLPLPDFAQSDLLALFNPLNGDNFCSVYPHSKGGAARAMPLL